MSEEKKAAPPRVSEEERSRAVPPLRMFDDLSYVGNRGVGIYVLETSEGLVLFDASDNTDAYEKYLKPGLETLGLSHRKVLALFLTHGHFDHYLGSDSIRKGTGCQIGLSLEDTAFMPFGMENVAPDGNIKSDNIPRITFYIQNGRDYAYGDHTVTAFIAPGHTPGCLNFAFDVHEGGERHRVAIVGGFGVFGPGRFPDNGGVYPYGVDAGIDNALKFAASCGRFWQHCRDTGCDVILNPHPHLCNLFQNAEKNKTRQPGQPSGFVVGAEGVKAWLYERFLSCVDCAAIYADFKEAPPMPRR